MVAIAPAGFVKVNLVEMSVANVYCGTPCCVAPCDHLMTSTNPFKFVAPDKGMLTTAPAGTFVQVSSKNSCWKKSVLVGLAA